MSTRLDRIVGVSEGDEIDVVLRRRSAFVIAMLYIVSVSTLTTLGVVKNGFNPGVYLAVGCVILHGAAIFSLWRGLAIEWAGWLITFSSLVGNLLFMIAVGGVETFATSCLLPAAFIAGILCGSRAAIVVGMAAIISVWGVFYGIDRAVDPTAELISPVTVTQVIGSFMIFSLLFTHMQDTFMAAQQRAVEQAERSRAVAESASAAKSRFLANVSHEIRTPMNGVIGMTQVLRRTNLQHDQKLPVDTIGHSAEALLTVINDVLDFSKVESGRIELDPAPFEIEGVAHEVAHLLRGAAEDKGIVLNVEVSTDLPPRLMGDAGRIRQVLINLVGNAVKFTAKGAVSVRFFAQHDSDDSLVIEVEDSGIGIAEDKLEKVFDAFAQAEAATTKKFGGTGLGLAISRQLVQLMGGDITVRSTLGVGSTFTVTMPLIVAEDVDGSNDRTELGTSGEVDRSIENLRVLAADDNHVNRLVLEGLLGGTGVALTMVEDGAEAVEAVEAAGPGGFDVILMDVSMPGMDGFAATQAIRNMETTEGAPRVPILALTAHAGPQDRQRVIDAGMDDHITKPVQRDALLAALARWSAGDASAEAVAETA